MNHGIVMIKPLARMRVQAGAQDMEEQEVIANLIPAQLILVQNPIHGTATMKKAVKK